ncbi:antibiotic biosynthesis monooxygenase [Pedobacter petrophilus]|uniref:Antibiotic biosynthesis monooxygenase n=1 Tax=Pedobacter petrophilus TaxID=1908241 RepID=A0A7K0FVD8_9SPHI|nr:putative quinol monooxygenase [Pedobacter petrophilus]MRX75495.1 antibiotic biosynthesis monooxygenase [Pedobacter petrophilus]
MSIYLTAILKSKPEKKEELRTLLLNMVSQSRKEEACIQYDLNEVTDQDIFIFQEEWADESGLDLHNKQEYLLDFVAKSSQLTTEIVIHKTAKIA